MGGEMFDESTLIKSSESHNLIVESADMVAIICEFGLNKQRVMKVACA